MTFIYFAFAAFVLTIMFIAMLIVLSAVLIVRSLRDIRAIEAIGGPARGRPLDTMDFDDPVSYQVFHADDRIDRTWEMDGR